MGKFCMHCGGDIDENGYSVNLTEEDGESPQGEAGEELAAQSYADGGMVSPEDEHYEQGLNLYKSAPGKYVAPQESGFRDVKTAAPERYQKGEGSSDAGYTPSMIERFVNREEERRKKAKK